MAKDASTELAEQGEPAPESQAETERCRKGTGVTLAGLVFESAAGLHRLVAPGLEQRLGIAGQAVEVLIRLFRSPRHELRMVDLAAQTGLTPGGLTRAVDRLVEAGLVGRHMCASDRRVTYATLTGAGVRRTEEALARHERELGALLSSVFDESQADALVGLLRRLRDRVNPEAAQLSDDLESSAHQAPR